MLLSPQLSPRMSAPPVLRPLSSNFPQWSRTAILTISGTEEEAIIRQVKKQPPDQSGAGFIINHGDATARVAHLEHSVRFLQEQHRLMLSGLHAEIEALRERNRDLQFQLIFNKESQPKAASPPAEENVDSEEANLKQEVARLEREAAAARGEARAAEARALQLQRMVDAQAEKLRELELSSKEENAESSESESRAELRARLADAERLVRRLRGDAERQRREVRERGAAGVTNLLFDGALARHAHLQCMKNSLHASLRASGLDPGYGYQNTYHFPPVPAEFWREPLRDDFNTGRGRTRRPLTLPELAGQQVRRSTVYANNHTRSRANGYEQKSHKHTNGESSVKNTDEQPENRLNPIPPDGKVDHNTSGPELKVVVARYIPHGNVTCQLADGGRSRPRRHHHRKHTTEHT